MKNKTQIDRKSSKIKGRMQHRRQRFESAISFRAGKKSVSFRVPSGLKKIIAHAARELNISVAAFVRLAISEILLPRQ